MLNVGGFSSVKVNQIKITFQDISVIVRFIHLNYRKIIRYNMLPNLEKK